MSDITLDIVSISLLVLTRGTGLMLLLIAMVKTGLIYQQLPESHFKTALKFLMMSCVFFTIWFSMDIIIISFSRSGVDAFKGLGTFSALSGALGIGLVIMAIRKVKAFVDI